MRRNDQTQADMDFAESFLNDEARKISCPCLLVRGKETDMVSKEGILKFQQIVRHAEFFDVHGAGHMVTVRCDVTYSSPIV
jgi:pimeloyl-ACP methyl ester carboxylesterase